MKFALALSLCLASSDSFSAAQWPQFRGPNSSGVADDAKPPIQFNAETNLLWKIEISRGLSSPCIAGDRIFLTAFEDGKLFTLCFDRRTGKQLWRAEAPAVKAPDVHQVSSPAVATPATDGKFVFIYYPPFGLLAYDFNGKEQWRTSVPFSFVMNGSGTSPAIHEDTLVLNCDQDEGESSVLAVETRTGKTRWQTPRNAGAASYTTPIVWKRGRQEDVVVAGSFRVTGYDLSNGKERWTANVLTSVSVTPTPVIGDGHLFVMSRGVPPNSMGTFASLAEKNDKNGDGKLSRDEAPRGFEGSVFRGLDRDKDGFITEQDWTALTNLFAKGDSGIFALRTPGDHDITSTHVAWKQTRGVPGLSSPLFYRGRVFAVQDGGRVSCWDAKTGQAFYEQERLGADGEYYASPIAANGRVYFTSSKGTIAIIRLADTLDVQARNVIGESMMATPAIANDALYVRSAKHLWAFGRE
jgi:outer membrane protein assembly factor BamB